MHVICEMKLIVCMEENFEIKKESCYLLARGKPPMQQYIDRLKVKGSICGDIVVILSQAQHCNKIIHPLIVSWLK